MTVHTGFAFRLLYGDRIMACRQDAAANLDRMLVSAATPRANMPAVSDERRILTHEALQHRVGQIAAALRAQGLGPGDRIALFAGNGTDFIASIFGIWRLGAIAVPIGARQTAAELTYMLSDCQAAALMFDSGLAAHVPQAGAVPSVRLFVALDDGAAAAAEGLPPGTWPLDALLAGHAPLTEPSPAGQQDAACIMYTSGTTGRPKGAVLSHLGFWHVARNYVLSFGYRPDDRMLLVIPGTHISGLLGIVVVMAQVGGCVVCRRAFRAADILDTIEAEAVTAALMVPAMYNLLLLEPDLTARDLSQWRIGHFGGAAMAEASIMRLARALPGLQLYNGFGATETSSAVTLTGALAPGDALDTVGQILPGVDIRVLDPEGRELPPGTPGELWISGPGNAIGYWGNPEATRASFVGGYWRSGDIGSVDATGAVRVFDRIKDMINRGGYKVYCVELENVIHALPEVIEVAAVASPCEVLGERVHVFLHARAPLDAETVRAHCAQHLADYKLPDFVTRMPDPLPRNLNGKLVKEPLRKAAREAAAARQAGPAQRQMKEA